MHGLFYASVAVEERRISFDLDSLVYLVLRDNQASASPN